MLINYIPFYTHIWSDKKFKKLSTEAKLMFIYIFANNNVSLTGIYEFDQDICPIKFNGNFETIFQEIIQAEMIKWDEANNIVFVIHRFKLIPNKSPKVTQGVINELNMMQHPFRDEFIARYKDYLVGYTANLKGFETKDVNLLTGEQINAFRKLGWQRERLTKFYTDHHYAARDIEDVLNSVLSKLQ